MNQQDAQNSCMHRASSYNMYINQQDAQNSCMHLTSSYNMYINQQDAQNSCDYTNHKNSVHLVGLYTYCRMMHGVYNVKKAHDLCTAYKLRLDI